MWHVADLQTQSFLWFADLKLPQVRKYIVFLLANITYNALMCLITLCLLCLLFFMSLCLIISVSSLPGVLYVCSVLWSMFLLCLVFSVSALSHVLCVCFVWWSLCLLVYCSLCLLCLINLCLLCLITLCLLCLVFSMSPLSDYSLSALALCYLCQICLMSPLLNIFCVLLCKMLYEYTLSDIICLSIVSNILCLLPGVSRVCHG